MNFINYQTHKYKKMINLTACPTYMHLNLAQKHLGYNPLLEHASKDNPKKKKQ
jgi:hypothetical protein